VTLFNGMFIEMFIGMLSGYILRWRSELRIL